jgi:hypothetical protein
MISFLNCAEPVSLVRSPLVSKVPLARVVFMRP